MAISSTTSASTTVSSTSASSVTGIDYDALVQTVVAAKSLPADRIDVQVSKNEARIQAYQEMQSLTATLTDAANALRVPEGYGSSSDDLFDQRTAYVTGSSTASSLLGVSVANGTDLGSHSVEILQLATAQKIASDTQASARTALGLSGSFTIAAGSGTAQTINLTPTSTLTELAAAINDTSASSGVSASVLKVSDAEYRLVLTARDTGQSINLAGDDDGILSSLGLTDSGGAIANELVAAQPAILKVDGVQLTRTGNSITDIWDGVTLDLYGASAGTTLTVEIASDLSAIKTGIVAFADAYNALRDFVLTQQSTSSTDNNGNTTQSALFADSLMRQIATSLATSLNHQDGTNSLATLGITLDRDNKMVIDENTLDNALLSNLDAIKSLLGFSMESSSTSIMLLRRPATLMADNFTLDITVDATGAMTNVAVDGDSSKFTINGTRITGVEGTEFAGLVFVYTGGSASVDIKLTSGIADQIYQIGALASDRATGSLQSKIDDLRDHNSDLESRAADIRTKAEAYGENLREYYARLEAKAQTAKLLLKQLEAASNTDR